MQPPIQMPPISVVPLSAERRHEAVGVLARAFVTNPLHVAVFGPGAVTANEAFFHVGLGAMRGETHVAVDSSRIAGVVHWVDSPMCQFSAWQKLRHLPAMLRGFGLRSTVMVAAWLSAWETHDPTERHVHFGPIAVDPRLQRRGVGRILMTAFCGHLDATGAVGYLETDRPENVGFYQKFGFAVTDTALIHGILNYFMRRPPMR